MKGTSYRKKVALFLLCVFSLETFIPFTSFALTGGPSQPEVESFQPVGTSEMVDPFSGDFSYNIPLLKVGDYPVNLGYHAGIGMDQEASWVGLGWNINPGVINRSMRGIPDDFAGENLEKEFHIRTNRTFGVSGTVSTELFSFSKLSGGIGYTLGIKYNNYNGFSVNQGLNLSISAGEEGKTNLTAGLGLNSSSDEGLTVQPSVGLSTRIVNSNETSSTLGLKIGTSYNSRMGLQQLTINATAEKHQTEKIKVPRTRITPAFEVIVDAKEIASGSAGASFNFGMPTYTPSSGEMNMQNISATGSFKLGGEVYGVYVNGTIGGSYSQQKLIDSHKDLPAYGYMYADLGVNSNNAVMDFNREKDGSFNENTPSLPITNFTYDLYSVSGQGIGGSYRPFRSDIGYVFDPHGYTTSDGTSIGADLGGGDLFKAGVDINLTLVNSDSKKWNNLNKAAQALQFKNKTADPLYEPFYFKEANERSVDADPAFFESIGGYSAQEFQLDQVSKYEYMANSSLKESSSATPKSITRNNRNARERRNQNISFLKYGELNDFSVENLTNNPDPKRNVYVAPAAHIGEISALSGDGSRYVYGIAAYNTKQEETTFSVGKSLYDADNTPAGEIATGLVPYSDKDNSTGNDRGLDEYYSKTTMPAYAHSYLLTAVLSPEYVDADNIRGPSDGDLGNYTRFVYSKIQTPYKWRTPYGYYQASYNEGLKSDNHDDKASYIYGEKEIWYLDSIITRDYVACFEKDLRCDGIGVTSNKGEKASPTLMKLKKISLYSKKEIQQAKLNSVTPVPIQEVHFVYDYQLCPGVPNAVLEKAGQGVTGKLTLKKVFFTYRNSKKAVFSPYSFEYCTQYANNYAYNITGYDRWGNYKTNPVKENKPDIMQPLFNNEFPYVQQEDSATANANASAWCMTQIHLPSGGTIKIDYESDDYAYVQNKQAMEMFKICYADDDLNPHDSLSQDIFPKYIGGKSYYLYFKLKDNSTDISQYVAGLNNVYFRFLMEMKSGQYEYVSGYGEIDLNNQDVVLVGGVNYGRLKLKGVNLGGSGAPDVLPMVKAAIQFGRLYNPKLVWGDDDVLGKTTNFGLGLLKALTSSDIGKSIVEGIVGPNNTLYQKGVGTKFIANKSWIRLNSPAKHKFGGGSRVKKIEMIDNWAGMTHSEEADANYGQEYEYTNKDGSSSGVASYEPQLGGDENPWKQPVFFDIKKTLIPSDNFYMEEPFGESFFPSPNVGYSRVIVKNLQRPGVTRHATGYTINEFYTAYDFPTIASRTELDHRREKNSPFSLAALFNLSSMDYMTATQGFAIEVDDMHGKPKSVSVYQEGMKDPITSSEYFYKSEPYLTGSRKLVNKATVVDKQGSLNINANFGMFFDMVADMRESRSQTEGITTQGNVDGFLALFFPITVPIVLPSYSNDQTQFRSATTTKVIQRFGIVDSIRATDLGSVVTTKNLAYDAATGDVLLTQTATDFNDPVYALKIPAYWYYDRMGQAYQNIDFAINSKTIVAGSPGIFSVSNAQQYFVPGDELMLKSPIPGGNIKVWVSEVFSNSIKVIKKDGNPLGSGTYDIKIIRSGRKNTYSVGMMNLTSRTNPLNHIKDNVYENVLSASAIEFYDQWKSYCDCFANGNTGTDYTTNEYVKVIKGNFVPNKTYSYLTGRTQSKYNNNTNIREDGVFTSFTPFYKLSSGKWDKSPENWTYTSEITEYSPFDIELENKDALNRYSAATYGYNQTLPTSIAANSRYRDIAFDGFEDYDYRPCADNHFKFDKSASNVTTEQAHTGYHSFKVSGAPVLLKKQLAVCESGACTMVLGPLFTVEPPAVNSWIIGIKDGKAPFYFNWTIVSGTPTVQMINSGTSLQVTGAPSWKITVSCTDNNGCIDTKTYNKN